VQVEEDAQLLQASIDSVLVRADVPEKRCAQGRPDPTVEAHILRFCKSHRNRSHIVETRVIVFIAAELVIDINGFVVVPRSEERRAPDKTRDTTAAVFVTVLLESATACCSVGILVRDILFQTPEASRLSS